MTYAEWNQLITSQVSQDTIRKVLQTAYQFNFAKVSEVSLGYSGLGWFKRGFNWLAKKLGADKVPFTDPLNYREIHEMVCEVDRGLMERILIALTPEPVCSTCGAVCSEPDPAGYYCNAYDWRGAPLICDRCAI